MKFEDLLMQPSDQEKRRRVDLEKEVEKLQEELDKELKLSKILKCALQGPMHSCQCLSKLIPAKVQVLIAELATLEEEIIWLERKFDELNLRLNHENKEFKDYEYAKLSRRHRKQKKQLSYTQVNQTINICREITKSQDFKGYKSPRGISISKDILNFPATKYSGKGLDYLQWWA